MKVTTANKIACLDHGFVRLLNIARVYAQAVYDLLASYLPETMKFFDTYSQKLNDKDKVLLKAVLEQMGDLDLSYDEYLRLVEIFKRLGVK